MRRMVATLAMMLAALPAAAQDPRISRQEQDQDRIKAQALYDQQKQRDQAEADRVAKTNLDRRSDYDLYIAKKKAEHEARMAQWRADVARQKADYDAKVAKCLAEKTCSRK